MVTEPPSAASGSSARTTSPLGSRTETCTVPPTARARSTHAANAVPSAGTLVAGPSSLTSTVNIPACADHSYGGVSRRSMPDDVGQRLLDDPERGLIDSGRQRLKIIGVLPDQGHVSAGRAQPLHQIVEPVLVRAPG